MAKTNEQLAQLREKIDALDTKLLETLNARAEMSLEVGKLKGESDEKPLYYRPEREAQIIQRLKNSNKGPLNNEAITQIFRDVLSASLALQRPIKIAYLGPEGTFSQGAVLKHFGPSMDGLPVGTINKIFRAVESKEADYGMVPIENSTEGVENITLDCLMESSLQICGEVTLPIHQNLLIDKQDTTPIRRIYSHQQSLAQCRHWLENAYPDAERISVASNGYAAQLAKQEKGAAAIAGEPCAELYDLDIKEAKIEDNPDNTTRFLVVGHQETEPSGNDKTSLVFSMSHVPGALYRLLKPLAKNNVNLTLIESRPVRAQMWHYISYIDVEGHQKDKNLKKALAELSHEPGMLRVLGSYPKAEK